MQIYEARLRDDKRGVTLDFRCFAFRWPVDVNDCIRFCAATPVFYARRCAANRFARRQMDVDSRSAFAILSAASARNVAR